MIPVISRRLAMYVCTACLCAVGTLGCRAVIPQSRALRDERALIAAQLAVPVTAVRFVRETDLVYDVGHRWEIVPTKGGQRTAGVVTLRSRIFDYFCFSSSGCIRPALVGLVVSQPMKSDEAVAFARRLVSRFWRISDNDESTRVVEVRHSTGGRITVSMAVDVKANPAVPRRVEFLFRTMDGACESVIAIRWLPTKTPSE